MSPSRTPTARRGSSASPPRCARKCSGALVRRQQAFLSQYSPPPGAPPARGARNVVVACSALRLAYRDKLRREIPARTTCLLLDVVEPSVLRGAPACHPRTHHATRAPNYSCARTLRVSRSQRGRKSAQETACTSCPPPCLRRSWPRWNAETTCCASASRRLKMWRARRLMHWRP